MSLRLAPTLRLLMIALVAVVSLLAAPISTAQEPARLALLIGNLAYKPEVGRLRNPHNDITIVGAALKASGFRVLEPVKDATRAEVLRAVRQFAEQLKAAGPNAVGLLYYSGHGAAIGSSNYLIPVDVTKPDAASLADGGVLHREIIDRLVETAPQATHYLVIDACRNNLGGTKGPKGFRPERRRDGMLIAFAAEPDKPASDDGDAAGPFATALAAELAKPAQLDLLLFHNVRVAVDARTNGEQVPWIEDGIRRPERVRLGTAGGPAPAELKAEQDARRRAEQQLAEREATLRADQAKRDAEQAQTNARIRALEQQLAANTAQPKVLAPPVVPIAPAPPPSVTSPGDPALAVVPGSGRSFRDCAECPEMVVVPAGSFTMGSPDSEPERFSDESRVPVAIPAPFAVGRFAVTFAEWDACVADGGCGVYRPADKGWGRGKQPVINVNWSDAQSYVAWLSKKTGQAYRLLSEAEREYVARAGTKTPFWWGTKITLADANYDGSAEPYKGGGSKGEYRQRTVPVDSFKPNAWGLYQVHGNVWEWTGDCWNDTNAGNPGNGSARATGDCATRVLRGGSWYDLPRFLRSASRIGGAAGSRSVSIGFRVARPVVSPRTL